MLNDDLVLNLPDFVPYRLAVLAEAVSHTLSQIYADRFDLTRPEWRVLAALAVNGDMVARDIATYSTLDKMAVSRAVAGLEAKGHVVREDDHNDRRNKVLSMTQTGRALYQEIVPLARAREAFLLEALDPQDRAAFERILAALTERAREIERIG